MHKAYLVLSDGTVFEGTGIGAEIDSIGELVFTTGMVSYLETLTDPGYDGQIVMQTFPMIGNYGVMEADFEGNCTLRGYVVRECCDSPSNFRSQYHLEKFLTDHGIPGICGVDTRALTAIIRDHGVQNAMICTEVPTDLTDIRSFQPVPHAGRTAAAHFPAASEARFRVVFWDFGTRKSVIEGLCARGAEVTAIPAESSAAEILAMAPDGLVISNGPGDPAQYETAIAETAKLIGKLPIFGFGLGHQLLALAQCGKTAPLPYGHRGDNQPVRDLIADRTYITTQNHGYIVLPDTLPGVAVEHYRNANDGTCEGLDYPGKHCFSVQFHPGGDAAFVLDRFIDMMGGKF